MPLYRPSDLKVYLNQLGCSPRKDFSQNFLVDGNIVEKIIKKAAVQKQDIVIEIGPGPGVLTERLVELGVHVIAIEKDQVLANALKNRFGSSVSVIAKDVLATSFKECVQPFLKQDEKYKIVANIPYSITAAIIEKIIKNCSMISSAVLMLQEEAAKRCIAQPGSKELSPLSVFVQFYSQVALSFLVSPSCFYPKPKVSSAVIEIVPKEVPPCVNEEIFFSIVRSAYSQRRKMLKASLKYPKEEIEKALISIGHEVTARPEILSIKDWIELCSFFQENT